MALGYVGFQFFEDVCVYGTLNPNGDDFEWMEYPSLSDVSIVCEHV